MADIVILNYNDFRTTNELIDKIRNYQSINHIVIIDNQSTDGSYDLLRKKQSDRINVIKTAKNGGYGYGNNYGVKYLMDNYKSEYILLANPDVIISDECINALEKFLRNNNDFAIAAPVMLNRAGEKVKNTAFKIPSRSSYILSFGVIYSKFFNKSLYKDIFSNECEYKIVDAVAGSLFMMKSECIRKSGLFDEKIFLYCEEIVLGKKIRDAGYKIALLPKCEFVHNHSVSINKTYNSAVKKQRILVKSKLYVIKNYYNAKMLSWLFAKLMGNVSILENLILEMIRKILRK